MTTWTTSSYCYIDETHSKFIALQLVDTAYKLFNRAYVIRHFDELDMKHQETVSKGVSILNKEYPPDFFFKITTEIFIDMILICTAFENYMKAKLLMEGYIVHCIKKKCNTIKLREKQNRYIPVTIKDLKDKEKSQKNKGGYMHFPSIDERTLGISKLLRSEYQSVLNIPQDVVAILRTFNEKRNQLHFNMGNVFAHSEIRQVKILKEYVESKMKEFHNDLVDLINFPKEYYV